MLNVYHFEISCLKHSDQINFCNNVYQVFEFVELYPQNILADKLHYFNK